MSVTDAPDWQRIIATVPSAGAVPDAPDWQRISVGPGGGPLPVVTGGSTSIYLGAGMLGVSTDPAPVQSTGGHTEGGIGFLAFTPFATGTVNNIYVAVSANSSGFTANQNFVGIYDMGLTTPGSFTLMATSAAGAADSPFATLGMHKIALVTGANVVQGSYYAIAFLNNGAAGNFYFTQTVNTALTNPVGTTWPVRCITTADTHTSLSGAIAFSACTLAADTWLFYASE